MYQQHADVPPEYQKWAYKIHQVEWDVDITESEMIERARDHAEKMILDPDTMEQAMLELIHEDMKKAQQQVEHRMWSEREVQKRLP